jgi:hypothetical protein
MFGWFIQPLQLIKADDKRANRLKLFPLAMDFRLFGNFLLIRTRELKNPADTPEDDN